jgi:hypothetical protein
VKSSSYELSGIECMERTSEDVIVILPMAVIVIVNRVSVRASGINSLDPIRCEVIYRVIHPTRDNLVSEGMQHTNMTQDYNNET